MRARGDRLTSYVGRVASARLVPMLRRVERELDREVNVTPYPETGPPRSRAPVDYTAGLRDEFETAARGKQGPQTSG